MARRYGALTVSKDRGLAAMKARPPLGYRRRLSGFLHEKFSCWASLAHLFELGRPGCPLLAFRLRQFLTMEWVTAHPIRPGRAPVHAAAPHIGFAAGAALGQPAARTS